MTRLLGLAMAAGVCAIAATCASVPVLPQSGSSTPSVVSRGCEHLSRHQYEVCYAYIRRALPAQMGRHANPVGTSSIWPSGQALSCSILSRNRVVAMVVLRGWPRRNA
jgi:hypothetical protein